MSRTLTEVGPTLRKDALFRDEQHRRLTRSESGWLVGWLAGWLVGWLDGWLVGWSMKSLYSYVGGGFHKWCPVPVKTNTQTYFEKISGCCRYR